MNPPSISATANRSENLIREVANGNNLALIFTRHMGKTGLIQHCFNHPEIIRFSSIFMRPDRCATWYFP